MPYADVHADAEPERHGDADPPPDAEPFAHADAGDLAVRPARADAGTCEPSGRRQSGGVAGTAGLEPGAALAASRHGTDGDGHP